MKKITTLAFLLIGLIVTGYSQQYKVKVVCIETERKYGDSKINLCMVEDKDQKRVRVYIYATIPMDRTIKIGDKAVVDKEGRYVTIRGKDLDLTNVYYSTIKPNL